MAESTILNTSIKEKLFQFTNLAQYSPQGYYLYISGVKAKAGIPSNATLISASIAGWGGMGSTPDVHIADNDRIMLLYASNTTLTSSSQATIRFVYI